MAIGVSLNRSNLNMLDTDLMQICISTKSVQDCEMKLKNTMLEEQIDVQSDILETFRTAGNARKRLIQDDQQKFGQSCEDQSCKKVNT